MILVVDAYNVLKQVVPHAYIEERQRIHFIHLLSGYAKRKGHKIVVVFDGGPYERPFQEKKMGVYVVYVGVHETADDYIARYMQEQRTKDLLLISSDRSLCAAGKRLGIESIDAIDFYALVRNEVQDQASKPAGQDLIKTTTTENPELDILISEGSKQVHSKTEDLVTQRNRPAHKPSKQERTIAKKIKKL